MPDEHGQPADAPASSPPPSPASPMGSLDVGPVIRAPTARLLLMVLAAVVVVGLIAWPIIARFPERSPAAIPYSAIAVFLAFALGTLSMKPWQARPLGRWPMIWLAGRGVCFAAVLVLLVSLYFAARPEPVTLGLVAIPAYLAALAAESVVFSSHVRRAAGAPTRDPDVAKER